MKSAYILMAALFVVFTPASAQDDSPLRFDAFEWSFGDIREEGGTVSHIFEFVNKNTTPVAIDRVAVSCGCTTPEYPKTPIASGERAHIKVTFDPKGLPGDFSKSVTVVSGGGKYRDFLTITGHVVPRPKTIEEEFPHDMGGGIRVSSTLLTFRSIAQGHSSAMTVDYVNSSSAPVTLAFEPADRSGFLGVSNPGTVCAGCRGSAAFTYDLSEKSIYGQVHDVLKVVVDGVASQKTIYAAMTGIDDFSGVDMSRGPRLFLDASFHDFGEVRHRAIPYVFRLTASNEGSEDLHIRSVSETDGLRCTLRGGMRIAPGASLPFEITLYGNKYSPGEVRESIRLVVDDPMRPTREIRVTARVK